MQKVVLFSIAIWLSLPLACMDPDEKELEKQFFDAFDAHDIKTVKRLSQEVAQDTIKNVLTKAIEKNDTQVIEALINDIGSKDIQKALILAINTKNPDTVKTLLNGTLNIKIDTRGESLDTPLIHALNTQNMDIIKAILTEAPDPNLKGKQKKTALEIAQGEEKNLLTKAAAQFKLFVSIKSKSLDSEKAAISPELLTSTILSVERNPLTAAISGNDLKTVELLVEAVSKFDEKLIKSFVNQTLKGGMTPLRIAVTANKPDIVKFLLEKGATPNTPPDTLYGHTPLSKATTDHELEIIKLLLENEKNKANVNYQMPADNVTSLMIAAKEGYVDAVEMLLTFGANPLLQDINGETALEIAKEEKKDMLDDSPLLQEYEKIIQMLEKAELEAKKAPLPSDQNLISLLHKFTQSLNALQEKIEKIK